MPIQVSAPAVVVADWCLCACDVWCAQWVVGLIHMRLMGTNTDVPQSHVIQVFQPHLHSLLILCAFLMMVCVLV